MAASASDKFIKVGSPGTATTLSAPGYTAGNTSITVGSTSNWPTDTGVVFAIDQAEVVNGVEVQIAGTYNEFEGAVSSGTSVTGVDWKNGTGDTNYAAGPLTRVYIPVSAERENRLIDGLVVAHNQDGTLKNASVGASQLANNSVTTAAITDSAVTADKIDFTTFKETVTGTTSVTVPAGKWFIIATGAVYVTTKTSGQSISIAGKSTAVYANTDQTIPFSVCSVVSPSSTTTYSQSLSAGLTAASSSVVAISLLK